MQDNIYWSWYSKSYWNQCKLRYQTRFVKKNYGFPSVIDFEKSAFAGSVFHDSMQSWFDQEWGFVLNQPTCKKNFFDKVVTPIFEKYVREKKITFSHNERAFYWSQLETWTSFFWKILREYDLDKGKSYPEIVFKSEFPSGLSVGGRIDLVHRLGSSTLVFDWKATQPEYQTDEMNEQLMIYGLGVKGLFGCYPDGATFVYLMNEKLNFLEWTADQYEEYKVTLLKEGKEVLAGLDEPCPSFKCTYCEFLRECPHAPVYTKRALYSDSLNELKEGDVEFSSLIHLE